MKYGESAFDIIYLAFAILIGILILVRRKDPCSRLMGCAVLILGCGDAFHLVPRILNYFTDSDLTAALGIGKLVTSITMTVFYLLMYLLWTHLTGKKENRTFCAVFVLTLLRIVLCLFPQNGWTSNESSVTWGIIRNVPFVILGILIIVLYYRSRKDLPGLGSIWLLVLLSFLFYIPVAVAASIVPMFGMLMIPKTICYMIMIWKFWKYTPKKA